MLESSSKGDLVDAAYYFIAGASDFVYTLSCIWVIHKLVEDNRIAFRLKHLDNNFHLFWPSFEVVSLKRSEISLVLEQIFTATQTFPEVEFYCEFFKILILNLSQSKVSV